MLVKKVFSLTFYFDLSLKRHIIFYMDNFLHVIVMSTELISSVLANLQKQICVERITTFSGAQDWLLVEGKAKRKEWRDD
jgi:hypothetical protein